MTCAELSANFVMLESDLRNFCSCIVRDVSHICGVNSVPHGHVESSPCMASYSKWSSARQTTQEAFWRYIWPSSLAVITCTFLRTRNRTAPKHGGLKESPLTPSVIMHSLGRGGTQPQSNLSIECLRGVADIPLRRSTAGKIQNDPHFSTVVWMAGA